MKNNKKRVGTRKKPYGTLFSIGLNSTSFLILNLITKFINVFCGIDSFLLFNFFRVDAFFFFLLYLRFLGLIGGHLDFLMLISHSFSSLSAFSD